MNKLLLVTFFGALGGCATVQSGDFTVYQSDYEKLAKAVKNRASFEMQCPKEQLQLVVLNVFSGNNRYANQVGISGCEKRAVYLREPYTDTWVMNTETQPKQ
jgi:hypothetical protein